MVVLEKVSKKYGNNVVLEDINYTFTKGLYLLKGNSGSGKTTLLNIISGRCGDYSGEVKVSDRIFYLSSCNTLIEEFSVKENIELYRDLYLDFEYYCNDLGINKFINKKVKKLSKGEKQKVAIFIALSCNCKITLLDEPFSALDKENKKIIINELKKFSKDRLVILVSHNKINTKVVELKDKRIIFNGLNKNIKSVSYKVNLKNVKKWIFKLYKKTFINKFMFIISLCSICGVYSNFISNMDDIKQQFNDSFKSEEIYYKENNSKLDSRVFYNDVIYNLANEVNSYYYNLYLEDMYEVSFMINDDYFDNGVLFSNVKINEGLKDNEVILIVDYKKYCLDRGVSSCIKDQIKDELLGGTLIYKYNNYLKKYKILDVTFSDNNGIYVSDLEFFDEFIKIHKDKYELEYYLEISNKKLNAFYKNIRGNNRLVKYDFINVYSGDEYNYFLVKNSDKESFLEEEIVKDGVVACSDIGVSCSSFSYYEYMSISYIDNYKIDKLKYQNYSSDLGYDKIVISSSLAEYLNKKIGESITIRFYINDEFYVLNNVRIIDIINNKENIIFHNKYDYEIFIDRFNIYLDVKYIISEDINNYTKRDSLHYELIRESKNSLNSFISYIKFFITTYVFIVILILFIIEIHKSRKEVVFFRILRNNSNYYLVYNFYILFYVLTSIICLFDKYLFLTYYLGFSLLYFIVIKKIKSR